MADKSNSDDKASNSENTSTLSEEPKVLTSRIPIPGPPTPRLTLPNIARGRPSTTPINIRRTCSPPSNIVIPSRRRPSPPTLPASPSVSRDAISSVQSDIAQNVSRPPSPPSPIIKRDQMVPVAVRPLSPRDTTQIVMNGVPIDPITIPSIQCTDTDPDTEITPRRNLLPTPPKNYIPIDEVPTDITTMDLEEEDYIQAAPPTARVSVPKERSRLLSPISEDMATNAIISPANPTRRGRRVLPPIQQPMVKSEPIEQPISTTNVQQPIPRSNVEQPIPRSTVERPIPRSNVEQPIPRSTVEQPIPRSNVEQPIPRSNVQQPISRTNVEQPISRTNVQQSISTTNVEQPIPRSNVQQPIPRSNVERPIPRHSPPTNNFENAWDTTPVDSIPARYLQPDPKPHQQEIHPNPQEEILPSNNMKILRQPMAQVPRTNIPDYSSMPRVDQARYRANFRNRFSILRDSLPNHRIPDITEDIPLEEVHAQYDEYVRHIHIRNEVEHNRVYIIILWLFIELFCLKIGLNILGFTDFQMRSMNKYERLLIELGEEKYQSIVDANGGVQPQNSWPIELRIVFTSLVSAVSFIIIKMLSNYLGESMSARVVESFTNYLFGTSSTSAVSESGIQPIPESGGINLGSLLGGDGGFDLGSLFGGESGLDIGSLLASFGSNIIRRQAPTAATSNPAQRPTTPRYEPAYDE